MKFIFVLRRSNWFSSQCNFWIVVLHPFRKLFTLFQSPFIQVSPIRRALTCRCLSLWWFEHWKCLGVWSIILTNFWCDDIYFTSAIFWNTWERVILFGSVFTLSLIFDPFYYMIGFGLFCRLLLAPSLIQNFGWDSVFYLFGVLGVAWWELFVLFIQNSTM